MPSRECSIVRSRDARLGVHQAVRWLRCSIMLCLALSVVTSADATCRLYALWKPDADGALHLIKKGKPVGGDIILRLVVDSSIDPFTVRVDGARITELGSSVHDKATTVLPMLFPADPDPAWGDPYGRSVLQSLRISTSRYHNWEHKVAIDVSYKDARSGEIRHESATTNLIFKNLTVRDGYRERIFGFHPLEHPIIPLHCDLDHAQSCMCDVKYEVFSTTNNTKPVFTHEETNVRCPGVVWYDWNGVTDDGTRAKPGLYTYRITAQKSGDARDKDVDRSPFLSIGKAVLTEPTLDNLAAAIRPIDPGTPGYSDDDYYIHNICYSIKDSLGRAARALRVSIYRPTYVTADSWDYSILPCMIHRSRSDGIAASCTGMTHALRVELPDPILDADEPYAYVVSALDNHAALYKDHRAKPAIDWE